MGVAFFTKKFTSNKFSAGSRCKVIVPPSVKGYDTIKDAIVEILSKKKFMAKKGIKSIPKDKVACRILEAPNAGQTKVVGIEHPINRSWLVLDKHKCNCDMKTVLMVCGCKCGGC